MAPKARDLKSTEDIGFINAEERIISLLSPTRFCRHSTWRTWPKAPF